MLLLHMWTGLWVCRQDVKILSWFWLYSDSKTWAQHLWGTMIKPSTGLLQVLVTGSGEKSFNQFPHMQARHVAAFKTSKAPQSVEASILAFLARFRVFRKTCFRIPSHNNLTLCGGSEMRISEARFWVFWVKYRDRLDSLNYSLSPADRRRASLGQSTPLSIDAGKGKTSTAWSSDHIQTCVFTILRILRLYRAMR